jgi:nucleoside-diphosphate-sugar epimerase
MTYHYEKILVEQVVMSDPGLPGTVLRLPMVYGPGDSQHRLFPYLKRMDDGRSAILLEASQSKWRCTRGYVENVAAAIARAATDPRAASQVYNLGESDAFTEKEWVERLGRAVGWKGQVLVLPQQFVGKSATVLPVDWRHHLAMDTLRLREQLDFIEPIPPEEGLIRTVLWQRANPPAGIRPEQFDYAAEDSALDRANRGAHLA